MSEFKGTIFNILLFRKAVDILFVITVASGRVFGDVIVFFLEFCCSLQEATWFSFVVRWCHCTAVVHRIGSSVRI